MALIRLASRKRSIQVLLAAIILLALTACAVSSYSIREQLRRGDWQQVLDEIDATYDDEPVLHSLQKASVLYRSGQYSESNQALASIATAMEDLRGISITESTTSVLVNDNTRSYLASDFELAIAKGLQIINHLAQNQLDSARVEVLQANVLIEELEGEDKFAFLHVLSAMVFEMTGEPDQALVSYRKALESFEQQSASGRDVGAPQVVKQAYADLLLQLGLLDELRRSELQARELGDNSVRVFAIFSGSTVSPRVQTSIQHFSVQARRNFAVSIPHYDPRPPARYYPNTNLEHGLIVNLDSQQRSALQDMLPGITARTVARLVLKHQSQLQAEQEGGLLAGIAVGALNNLTEQADTRSADLLPGQMYFARQIFSPDDFAKLQPHYAALEKIDLSPVNSYFTSVDEVSGITLRNPQTNQLLIF